MVADFAALGVILVVCLVFILRETADFMDILDRHFRKSRAVRHHTRGDLGLRGVAIFIGWVAVIWQGVNLFTDTFK